MNLLSLENSLANGKFPVLDATLERFALLADKPTTTHQHLAEIIRADIGYTLAMFNAVNRDLPPGRDPVQSIEHAISMLGAPRAMEAGRELVKISSFTDQVQKKVKNLYSQAFHASQYFQALAIQNRLPHPAETAKNIKLMNLAEVMLLTNKPDALDTHVPCGPDATAGLPVRLLDKEMRELGLALARQWKLPTDIQQSLSPLDTEKKLPLLVNLASLTARQTAFNWHNEALNELVSYWSEFTEIPGERITATLHQLAAETGRQIDGRHLPVPAFFLFFPPPPKPQEKSQEESQAKPAAEEKLTSSPKANIQKAPRNAPPSDKPEVTKKPASPLQEAVTRQMKNMKKEAGVSRVMFAMLSPDRKKLGVRFVMGGEKNDAIRHFQADMAKKNIFSLLMSKPQGMHLTKDNYKKYLQLIPSMEKKSLQVNNLFAMSFFVKDKAIGLFIADNKKQVLSAGHYKKFKHFCNQAARDLANSSRNAS